LRTIPSNINKRFSGDEEFPLSQADWISIVRRYSEAMFTYPDKDKLTALSGLARATGPKSEYLAGMWKKDLPSGLLWRPTPEAACVRPHKYQAPSWSWASLNGPIYPHNNEEPGRVWHLVADIIETHIELAGIDPTGPVQAGSLRIRGCLAPITIPLREQLGIESRKSYEVVGANPTDNIRCCPDVDLHEGETEFYLLLIGYNDMGFVEPVTGSGLMLQPTGANKGEFYRRGLFWAEEYKWRERMPRFLEPFNRSTKRLNPNHFISAFNPDDRIFGLHLYEVVII
jgi:hypothetical protein